MSLFGPVSTSYRILALIVGALVLVGFGWVKGANYEQGQQARRDAKAVVVNTGITEKWQKGKDNALIHANLRATIARANARDLALESDGLREQLALQRSKLPEASLASCRQYAATLNTIFGECKGVVQRLADEATGHASDSLMYQESWPTK